MSKTRFLVGAVAALTLAVPGMAAAHGTPTPTVVKMHVSASDKALDTAAMHARKGQDAMAGRQFGIGRAQLAQAKADAAKLVRSADSPQERAAAARAQELVADEQNEWIDELPALLPLVEGRFEMRLSAALFADVSGREAALETLVSLLEQGVPAEAQVKVAKAISELATQRDAEVDAVLETLAGGKVEQASKTRLVACLSKIVQGQAKAAKRFAAVAETVTPEAAAVFEQAYRKILSEHGVEYKAIAAGADEVGAAYRVALKRIGAQAQQAGRQLEAEYPQGGFSGSGSGSGSGGGSGGSGDGDGSGEQSGGSGDGSGGSTPPAPSEPTQPAGGEQPPAEGTGGPTP